jgi:hypothetical protein
MEIIKKVIMEIGTVLTLMIVCFLVVSLLDYSKASEPEPAPEPETGETSNRYFCWDKTSISKSYRLNTTVVIRNDAFLLARKEYLDSLPSKVFMRSSKEYFDIAYKEIMHAEYGAFNYEISQVAKYLTDFANSELLSDIEFAGLILSFTHEQCIAYQYDEESTGYDEYMRLPLETLYDTVGDCDCKAILASALFKTLGFRVAFALMPGHAALAITLPKEELPFSNFVWKGEKWYYCESTGNYWNPGIMPDEIDPSEVELMEI